VTKGNEVLLPVVRSAAHSGIVFILSAAAFKFISVAQFMDQIF
jgi:hypothetical protein